MKHCICIGFDGKQDSTLSRKSGVCRTIKEEHYVLVCYPSATYIDHVMPDSSKASDVAKEVLSIVRSTDSETTLLAVVCDGTVNNTGKRNGVICKIEEGVGRALQWLICLLHTNELPFRKYVSMVEGGFTTGPSTSTGVITSVLNFDPTDLPIVNFLPIAGRVSDVSEEVKKDLSTDQMYLLRACLAVQQGITDDESRQFLKNSVPGNLNHARWLTKANRILRLYMSQVNCSQALYKVARFIVNVYAPSWFNIKQHSSCFDGAKNFFHLMKLCSDLGEEDWKTVKSVLHNNAYFAHPENILLAGVADDDESIRKVAIEKIITARACTTHRDLRAFDNVSFSLNNRASSYMDMIFWESTIVTPPPLLSNVFNDDLQHFSSQSLRGILCHSQQVKRAIQDVSTTTCKVFGHHSCHGMALQCKKSRNEIPPVTSKSDFL